MTNFSRPQANPGHNYVSKPSGSFALPLEASNDVGLIDIIDLCTLSKNRNKVQHVLFNDAGDAFATVDTAGHVVVFYIAKDKFISVCRSVHPTSLLLTERYHGMLFLGMDDCSIQVYNLAGKLLKQLNSHKRPIKEFSINSSRDLVLSRSEDTCVLWNLSTLKSLKVLHSRHTTFSCACFSPSEDFLITCYQDCSVYFWNLDTFQLERRITIPSIKQPRKITVSPEGNMLALIGESALIYMFYFNNIEEHHQSFCLPVGCEGVSDICFLKEDKLLLLGTEGMLYCIDSRQDNRVIFTKCLPGRKPIVSFTINRRNRFLLAIAESGEVYLFDFVKLMGGAERTLQQRAETGLSDDLVYQTLKPNSGEGLYHQTFTSKALGGKREEERNPLSNKKTYDPLKSLADDSQPIAYYPSDVETPNEVNEEAPRNPSHRRKWSRNDQENRDLNRERSRSGEKNESYLKSSGKKREFQRHGADSLEDISHSQNLVVDMQNLSKPYLAKWLGKHGCFPANQRTQIWRFLLELPTNSKSFNALISKGIHPKYENFFEQYPRTELSIKVQEMLSCLAFHNEAFTKIDFLPDIILPFVRVFGENEIICFEIILSFFAHWGQHFFQNNTRPSELLFGSFEKILEYHEPYLYEHLKNLLSGPESITVGDIFWTFTQTLFIDILNREDWHALTDFLVLHRSQPKFLLYFPVAYFAFFKDLLLDEQDKENLLDIRYFMERKADVDIYKIIETMTNYAEKTPTSVFLVSFLNSLPLPRGSYPALDFYTPSEKDHYGHMQNYIEHAEKKREERKEQLREVYGRLEDIMNLSATFQTKQKPRTLHRGILKDQMLRQEEQNLKRKAEIDQAARDRRLLQLKEMEDEMRRCLERQEKIRQDMFIELEKEKAIKKQIEEERLKLKLEEEDLLQQELEAIQKDNENLETRYERERERGEKLDTIKKEREEDVKDAVLRHQIRAEEDEYQMQKSFERKRWDKENRMERSIDQSRDRGRHNMVDDFERELQRNDIEREKKLEQLHDDRFHNPYAQQASSTGFQYNRTGESGEKRNLDTTYDRHQQKDGENVVQKGRERMKILGEERESLLRDLEESKRRLEDLNRDKKKKEEMRKVRESRNDESRLNNSSLQYDEERRLQEIEREYTNKDQIEQENQDFDRTLRETEKRILEQDKMNYEQLREATRQQMISIDEGQRKSVGGGKNVSFDYSREEERSRKANFESRKDGESVDEKTRNRYGVRISTGEDEEEEEEGKYSSQKRGGRRNSRDEDRIRSVENIGAYSYSETDNASSNRRSIDNLSGKRGNY